LRVNAKANCGSKVDGHEHVGTGKIGKDAFGRLLNDPRTVHAAFIAETPIDPRAGRRSLCHMTQRLGMSMKEAVWLVRVAPVLYLICWGFSEGTWVLPSRFHSNHMSQRGVLARSKGSGSLLSSAWVAGCMLAEREYVGVFQARFTTRVI